jgi:hypothetical protein
MALPHLGGSLPVNLEDDVVAGGDSRKASASTNAENSSSLTKW